MLLGEIWKILWL